MRIYLDLCVYNRPFDDHMQPRNFTETVQFLVLLEKAINKEITLINSFALEEENRRNPFINRMDKIGDLLNASLEYVGYSKRLENRAKEIEKLGVMGMDALHIACAEFVRADFLVTCDDLLVRKGRTLGGKLRIRIINLMEFVVKEVFKI